MCYGTCEIGYLYYDLNVSLKLEILFDMVVCILRRCGISKWCMSYGVSTWCIICVAVLVYGIS